MRNDSVADHLRLGATIRPQGRLEWFHDGKSCALGAIAEAIGFPYREETSHWDELVARFPILARRVKNPVTHRTDAMITVVFHLNDGDRWTREHIADWVETVEREFARTYAVSESRELVTA